MVVCELEGLGHFMSGGGPALCCLYELCLWFCLLLSIIFFKTSLLRSVYYYWQHWSVHKTVCAELKTMFFVFQFLHLVEAMRFCSLLGPFKGLDHHAQAFQVRGVSIWRQKNLTTFLLPPISLKYGFFILARIMWSPYCKPGPFNCEYL